VLIDRSHLGWGLAAAVALALATVGYILSAANRTDPSGGTPEGLIFGILAFAAMVFAGLLAVRKSFPAVRFGSAQFWLRGHIWLGLLSLPLSLYHSNFRLGGTLEMALMLVVFVVIASGVYGLVLQQVLPRLLKVRVPLETFPQQIPALCQNLLLEGGQLLKALESAPKAAGSGTTAIALGVAEKSARPVVAGAAKPASGASKPAVAAAKSESTGAAQSPLEKLKAAAAAKKAAASVGGAAAEGVNAPAAAGSIATGPSTDTAVASATMSPIEKLKAAAAAKKAAAADQPAAVEPKPQPEKPAVAPPSRSAQTPSAIAALAKPQLELLTRFYQQEVCPFFDSDSRKASRQKLASESYARMMFAELAAGLPDNALAAVSRLSEMVAERRQFLLQVRIHRWLHNWLLVHVPLSAVLFALAAIHIVMALRVVPW
jgi:hypothetical protein